MTKDEQWAEALAFRPRLLRLAMSRLRSWHDAEDAVSEAFARIPKAPDDMDLDRFHGWLAVVVLNVIKDDRRAQPTADDLARVAYAEPQTTPDHAERIADQAEGAWLWERGLRALPPKRRRVMHAMCEPCSAVQAVAAELGGSYVEAQNELARTRGPLRDLLARSRQVGVAPVAARLRVRLLAVRSRLATAVPALMLPALVVAPFLGHGDRPHHRHRPVILVPGPATTFGPPRPLVVSGRMSPPTTVLTSRASRVTAPQWRNPVPPHGPSASNEANGLPPWVAPDEKSGWTEPLTRCVTNLIANPQNLLCGTPSPQ